MLCTKFGWKWLRIMVSKKRLTFRSVKSLHRSYKCTYHGMTTTEIYWSDTEVQLLFGQSKASSNCNILWHVYMSYRHWIWQQNWQICRSFKYFFTVGIWIKSLLFIKKITEKSSSHIIYVLPQTQLTVEKKIDTINKISEHNIPSYISCFPSAWSIGCIPPRLEN